MVMLSELMVTTMTMTMMMCSDMVLSHQELIELCRRIKAGCTHYRGDPQFSVSLSFKLIKFRALLSWEEMLTTKPATLKAYWKH